MTRREFLGMASVGVVAVAVAGRYGLMTRSIPVPPASFPVHRTDGQWRAMLTPASYNVLREAGTEPPFSSKLLTEHRKGVFVCGGCASPVYRSETKFDSHTGWPSFWQPLPKTVIEQQDLTLGRPRTAIGCANCGSHLGHVFGDGPKPTGLRYCMNGVALSFILDRT